MDPRAVASGAVEGEDNIGALASAIGMSNDAAPDGYNKPKG